MLIHTYPRFPPFLLYFMCKLGVTFARRCFRDLSEKDCFLIHVLRFSVSISSVFPFKNADNVL